MSFKSVISKTLTINNKLLFSQILKFCVSGLFGTSINYGTFFILFYILNINYILAGIIAFVLPIPMIFKLNRNWTFISEVNFSKGLFFYIIVCLIGLMGHTSTLFLVTEFLRVNPLISQLPALMMSTFLNFTLSKLFVFKK